MPVMWLMYCMVKVQLGGSRLVVDRDPLGMPSVRRAMLTRSGSVDERREESCGSAVDGVAGHGHHVVPLDRWSAAARTRRGGADCVLFPEGMMR